MAKQKIKAIVKKPALILLLIVSLSCEKERLLPEEQTKEVSLPTPIDVFSVTFSLDNFNDPAGTIKNNLHIQWENYTTKEIEETLWYEFDITQTQKANIVSNFQADNQYKLLARVDENNQPHYFMAKLAPQKVATLREFSYLNPEHFTGTVALYNLQGEVVFLEYYKAGIVQNTIQDMEATAEIKAPFGARCMEKGTAMARCATALDCAFAFAAGESTGGVCGSGGNAGGSYVAVRTDHYTDWYNVRNNGMAEYSHTQFNGSSYEYVYIVNVQTYGANYQNTYNYYNYTGHGEYGNSEDGYYTNTPPSDEIPDRVILVPPSCHSFSFQNTTNTSLWQSAAVKNIKFKVYYMTDGHKAFHEIIFPQPILFEMPTNMIIGGDISPGLAAELSAQALKVAMDETVHYFKNIYATETIIRLYFEERLRNNYPLITNGGRVNVHPINYNVVPTNYVTTTFGTGRCQ